MARNVDDFVTESEHFNIDHTGIMGVGGVSGAAGVEILDIATSFFTGGAAPPRSIAANTLTQDDQSLWIKYMANSGNGAAPTLTVAVAGVTQLTVVMDSNNQNVDVSLYIVRTGAMTARAVATAIKSGNVAQRVATDAFAYDWTVSQSVAFTFTGGSNEEHRFYQLQKYPQPGSLLGLTGIGSDTLPLGSLVPYGGPVSSIPVGFLACDGSTYSETTYADLFAVIGTTWNTGGEPGGFFRVPDLRGKDIVSLNDGTLPAGADGGLTTRALGDTGGAETHTLSTAEMAAHSHNVQQNYFANVNATNSLLDAGSNGDNFVTSATISFTRNVEIRPNAPGQTSSTVGSNSAHNNMQPFAVCAYIIKAQQVGGGIGTSAQLNGGALEGPQPTFNLIEGAGVSITVAENVPQNRVDITLASSGGSPGLQLVERRVVTGSAVSTVSFTGLDGNTDEIYLMHGHLALDGAFTDAIDVRPNGATVSFTTGAHRHEGSVGPHNVTDLTSWQVMANYGTAFANAGFYCIIFAKANVVGDTALNRTRQYRAQGFTSNSVFDYVGAWNDFTTNITSLDLVTSSSNNRIGVGSVIKLYKLPG